MAVRKRQLDKIEAAHNEFAKAQANGWDTQRKRAAAQLSAARRNASPEELNAYQKQRVGWGGFPKTFKRR